MPTPLHIASVISLFICTSVFGQQEVKLEENAALWYWRAMYTSSMITEDTEEFVEELWSYEKDLQKHVSIRMKQAIEDFDRGIKDLHSGAAQNNCRFAIDRLSGPGMLLPHLAFLQTPVQYLCIDARLGIEKENTDRVVHDLVTGYRIAMHVGMDGITISSMVAKKMFEKVDNITGLAIDAGILTDEDCKVLLSTLIAIQNDDPFGFALSIEGERQLYNRWFASLGSDLSGRHEVIDFIVNGDDSTSNKPIEDIRVDQVLPEDIFLQGVNLLDSALSEIHRAFLNPDLIVGRETVQTVVIQYEVEISEPDPRMIPGIFLIDVSKFYHEMENTHNRLARRIESLEQAIKVMQSKSDPPP